MNQSRLVGFTAVFSEIAQFLEIKHENDADQPVPMDVGSLLHPGKGKKGIPKGKGKRKGTFNGHCRKCGAWGHAAKECQPNPTQNLYDSDKRKKITCHTCGKVGHYASERWSGANGSGKKGGKKGEGKKGSGKKGSGKKGLNYFENEHQWSWSPPEQPQGPCPPSVPSATGMSTPSAGPADAGGLDLCGIELPPTDRDRQEPFMRAATAAEEPLRDVRARRSRIEAKYQNETNGLEAMEARVTPPSAPRDCKEILALNAVESLEEITASVDSGAGVSIMPERMCEHVPVHPTNDSRAGVVYKAASGHAVPDLGSRTFSAQTETFQDRRLTCKVGPARKLLMSVSDMLERGNRVVFDANGSYAEHVQTGQRTPLHRENGVFVMKLWVRKPGHANSEGTNHAGNGCVPSVSLSALPCGGQPASSSTRASSPKRVTFQDEAPTVPPGSIIRTAGLQNFYRLAGLP